MKLHELFDTKVKIDRGSEFAEEKSYSTYFQVGGRVFRFSAEEVNSFPSEWEVLFSSGLSNYDITGGSNAPLVFGAVMSIMKKFIKKYKPEVIKFYAKERSRVSLYDKMVKRFSSVFGYELTKRGMTRNGTLYYLVRK